MGVRRRNAPLQRSQLQSLPLLLASIAAMSLPSASAQTTAVPTEAPPLAPSTLATSFTSSAASSSLSDTTAASSTSTTGFAWPTSIDNAPDTSFNDEDDGGRDGMDDRRGGLINYYFVFLALFIVLVFLGIYFLNRRRQARKEAWRTSGQNALQRDMDGWVINARRWHRRNESGGMEGLNELGQAPPPYAAKGQHSRETSAGDGSASGGPQVPLRALARDERERERERDMAKPPEYTEAIRADSTIGQHTTQEVRESSPPPRVEGNSRTGNAPGPS